MRIAIAGGTGVVGTPTVEAVQSAGHETIVLARSRGIDLLTGAGVDAALDGVDAVIDTLNVTTLSADAAVEFFTRATGNLIAASERAGVTHVVVLSIVGIDRIPVGYYAGKLAQESTGYRGWVPSVSIPTAQLKGMREGLALPGPDADLGSQTFADWLAARSA
ncbi:SDR family oxidoreductase [Microbacterium sp. A196]|uniref:SDR family oxidoreductase n=1 Tax=unclassified Microbacterium TaxID=2609290 RepID=UPI003FD4FED5